MSDFVVNDLDRFRAFVGEFREESNRGCAVLVLCVLEESLRAIIGRVVTDPNSDLRSFAPPGRLSVTIESAYLLGVLSHRERAAFQTMIKIRNAFAHKALTDLTFDSEPIVGHCRALQLPVQVKDLDFADLSNRERFLTVASVLQIALSVRTDHAKRLPIAADV